MPRDGGELLVRTLKAAKVDHAFVLHGGHLDPIFQACLDHDLHLVDTRHEAAAGHAADAYARQTGRIGVAIATAGPGYTNILTAVTQAYLDRIPVLFLIGASPLRDAEKWPLQGGIDQIAMARPVTKYAAQVTRTDQIPHMTAHAIRTAMTGTPGPVVLELPIDVLYAQLEEDVHIPQTVLSESAPAPSDRQLAAAIALLQNAARPVIVAGGGVLLSGASEAVREFAEATGIPVLANNKALGTLPYDHPLCGYSHANLGVLSAMGAGQPDAALFLGARFGMFTLGDRLLPPACKVIQVDIDGAELGRLRTVEVAIRADCRETARSLTRAATGLVWPDWSGWSRTIHELSRWHESAYVEAASRTPGAVHPYAALREIMRAIPEGSIICGDGGETSQWAELASRARAPGQYTGHGYLGCLGIGMPFAIGSQVARPDKRVICIVGDGSVGLNIQEFDTMVRHNLPVLTVVLNNKAWGMCVHGQQAMFGANRLVVTTLGESRYDKVAEGFGCVGAFVDDVDGIGPAVRQALDSGRPACINVITDLEAVYGDTGGEQAQQAARASDRRTKAAADTTAEIVMPYYDNLRQD
ncbi:MAG: thiamine pyrophosphate-binding protein [Pseudomonadales bacterium]